MRTLLFSFLVLVMIIFPFSGCNRQKTLSPQRWVAAGGEFDSLTRKLEWQFNDYAPYDSILKSVRRMEKIAAEEGDTSLRKLKKERALYWKARYLWRLEYNDSSLKLAKVALSLNDSSAYFYDRLRIISLICTQSDSIDGGAQYRHFEESIEYARKIRDKAFEAYSAINMGNLLGSIGEYDKALYYLNLSDSLNSMLGYKKLPVKNKINVARVLQEKGEKRMADSILKSLIGHPCLKNDTFAMNLLPRNLYGTYGDSTRYLYQAYNEIKDNHRFRFIRGVYLAMLANYSYSIGELDSCIYYARKSQEDLPYVSDYGHKAMMWFNIGLAWSVVDRLDSALMSRVRYELYLDSMQMQRRTSEVLRLSALHEIGVREAEYSASIFRRNMIMAFVVVVLVAGGTVVALWLNRRHLRQKMKAMQSELELEKAKRKMAATALTIEEKDKVLGTLRTELSEMREEGEIKEGNARRLESTIKSHMLEHDNDEAFREMFDVVNPGFTERLRERCPDLADSYVKLACYMLMELDNKKIARLMMIKMESVRQAKWRLRQRLDLPEGETLEAFLRRLNKP